MTGAAYRLGRKAPFAQIPIALLEDDRADAFTISTYVALRSFCDIGHDLVSDEIGAKRAGCSPRCFRDRRGRLKEMGWVEWTSGKLGGEANRYVVHEVSAEEVEEADAYGDSSGGSAGDAEGGRQEVPTPRQEVPTGSAGGADKEDIKTSPPRAREGADVENSDPEDISGEILPPDHRLDDYLADQAGAMDFLRSADGYAPRIGQGLFGLYGPNGTQERIWRGVDFLDRPRLLATAILRAGSEAERFHGSFFSAVLRKVIEEDLSPTPPENARARRERTPVGRLTAEEEAEREARRRAAAEERRRTKLDQEALEEQAWEEERQRKIREWLEAQSRAQRDELEAEVRRRLRSAGWEERAPPAIVEVELHRLVEEQMTTVEV